MPALTCRPSAAAHTQRSTASAAKALTTPPGAAPSLALQGGCRMQRGQQASRHSRGKARHAAGPGAHHRHERHLPAAANRVAGLWAREMLLSGRTAMRGCTCMACATSRPLLLSGACACHVTMAPAHLISSTTAPELPARPQKATKQSAMGACTKNGQLASRPVAKGGQGMPSP